MVAALEPALPALGCTLEVVDVDADPALEARYDERVPVLTLDGAEICHHFLDGPRLLAALGLSAAALATAPQPPRAGGPGI